MLASIFLLIAMASLLLAVSFLIYEIAYKGIRNMKEINMKRLGVEWQRLFSCFLQWHF